MYPWPNPNPSLGCGPVSSSIKCLYAFCKCGCIFLCWTDEVAPKCVLLFMLKIYYRLQCSNESFHYSHAVHGCVCLWGEFIFVAWCYITAGHHWHAYLRLVHWSFKVIFYSNILRWTPLVLCHTLVDQVGQSTTEAGSFSPQSVYSMKSFNFKRQSIDFMHKDQFTCHV